jgi:hypothetical protein
MSAIRSPVRQSRRPVSIALTEAFGLGYLPTDFQR